MSQLALSQNFVGDLWGTSGGPWGTSGGPPRGQEILSRSRLGEKITQRGGFKFCPRAGPCRNVPKIPQPGQNLHEFTTFYQPCAAGSLPGCCRSGARVLPGCCQGAAGVLLGRCQGTARCRQGVARERQHRVPPKVPPEVPQKVPPEVPQRSQSGPPEVPQCPQKSPESSAHFGTGLPWDRIKHPCVVLNFVPQRSGCPGTEFNTI